MPAAWGQQGAGGGGSSFSGDVTDRAGRLLGIADRRTQWIVSSNPGAGVNASASRNAQAAQKNIAQVITATYFNNSAAARTLGLALVDAGSTIAQWSITAP